MYVVTDVYMQSIYDTNNQLTYFVFCFFVYVVAPVSLAELNNHVNV